MLKVNRSWNMKQKVYEILTSSKIQTNNVILNNCIDYVCLFFDRLLLLELSAGKVLHTYYVATFQDRKTNLLVCFLEKVSVWQFCFEIYWPLLSCCCHKNSLFLMNVINLSLCYSYHYDLKSNAPGYVSELLAWW